MKGCEMLPVIPLAVLYGTTTKNAKEATVFSNVHLFTHSFNQQVGLSTYYVACIVLSHKQFQ